jgi:hypothetical protein
MFELIQIDGTDLICYDNGDIWRQNKNYKEEVWKKFVSIKKYYWQIEINKKHYLNHRLIANAFLGLDLKSKLVIDHKNHDIHNNSVANLRVVTIQQNNFNLQNVRGFRKRIYIKPDGTEVITWQIHIGLNGKQITKNVKTRELAHYGYLELKKIYHII